VSLPSADHIAGLYTRFGAALTRAGRRILRDAAEVDDVVQEAFCHYCQHASGVREPAAAYAYLKRSVMNLCFNRIRSGRADPTDPADQLFGALPAPDQTGQTEARNRLQLLLAGMDDEMLAIGTLYHLDGLTQDEIAESLDISRRTVGKKLQQFDERARKRAARLEGEGT
jgi:RNA polymerase sigma factor (sigma-70 family)